ncbi:hypothetical protein ACFWWA_17425 [Streptomyces goshikiensis]|uniref:hypothetical protein n=1 Tax=Streptomyces goshikiensis TaxID=1942 RepID=UPI00365F5479
MSIPKLVVYEPDERGWRKVRFDGQILGRAYRASDMYLRPDWRAAAWWLAHVFPEHYGPNAQSWEQVLDSYDAEQATIEHTAGPDDLHLAELAERLAATLAS